MILFCDTSALVKLYVDEPGADNLRRRAQSAAAIAVARIGWAEAMAGLARRQRESPGQELVLDRVRSRLKADWASFLIIEVTQAVVELAGDYAETFALRGYDSVQLAAAQVIKRSVTEPVCFACFDRKLEKAAQVLGFLSLSGERCA